MTEPALLSRSRTCAALSRSHTCTAGGRCSHPVAKMVLVALAVLFAVACGTTPEKIPADTAARQIADQLEAEVGQRPDEVRCPSDLQARVGAEMRCELVDRGVTYGIGITITEVDGGVATFDIRVDDTPE